MKFFRVGAVSPYVHVANPPLNGNHLVRLAHQAVEQGIAFLAFPELSLTGYSCGDLFFRADLQQAARKALDFYVHETAALNLVSVVGLPLRVGASLYNVAAVVAGGAILGFIPKSVLPTYGEYYERRQFTPAPATSLTVDGIPFGTNLLFEVCGIRFGVEICEDLWMPCSPSARLASAGLDLMLNISASTDYLGKSMRRLDRVKHQSAALGCVYVMASSGPLESTADAVFGGHNVIAANGSLMAQSTLFSTSEAFVTADVNFDFLRARRLATTSLCELPRTDVTCLTASVTLPQSFPSALSPTPFLDEYGEPEWVEKTLQIQASALARRLALTGIHRLIVGVSGGADSALALLGCVRTLALRGEPLAHLIAVVMPGFGSTSATQSNAFRLATGLGCTVKVIDIQKACLQHLADIGHDDHTADITFENVQARERTQVLMDLANMEGALVVGTGDLSEIALGWNTYNGDHMSMYQINASIPKTMVLEILKTASQEPSYPDEVRTLLAHIATAPITPELVPGAAANDTEARLGPYALHDFFLYYFVTYGADLETLIACAEVAFKGVFATSLIQQTAHTFLKRFFASQYKRDCVPDGPKITLTLSPRADWRCPPEARAF